MHIEDLHRLLICDAARGVLIWRARDAACRAWNSRYAGKLALAHVGASGYARGAILDRSFAAHRVIYAMHHGEWPAPGLEIDHINGIRHDNRIENLRLVTRDQNRANAGKRPRRAPASRFIGVVPNGSGWSASLIHQRRKYWGGTYRTEDEAARARDALAVKVKGEFARLNFPEASHG